LIKGCYVNNFGKKERSLLLILVVLIIEPEED
jgi:hypothetical protein